MKTNTLGFISRMLVYAGLLGMILSLNHKLNRVVDIIITINETDKQQNILITKQQQVISGMLDILQDQYKLNVLHFHEGKITTNYSVTGTNILIQ